MYSDSNMSAGDDSILDFEDSTVSAGSETETEHCTRVPTDKKRKKPRPELLGLKKWDVHAIRASRAVFFGFLLVAGLTLGWVVNRTATDEETQHFETEYDTLVQDIMSGSQQKVRQFVKGLESVSTTMTAFAQYDRNVFHTFRPEEEQYPHGFITLPHVEQQFGTVRRAVGALAVAYAPMVTAEELDQWNSYSRKSQAWLSESNGGATTKPILPNIWGHATERGTRQLTTTTNTATNATGGDCAGEQCDEYAVDSIRVPLSANQGPFAPVWTVSPPPPPDNTDVINYNLLDESAFQHAIEFGKLTGNATFLDIWHNQVKWIDSRDHPDSLQMAITYPVFEEFGASSDAIGHLIAIFPWKLVFEDVLQAELDPIVVVMESSCGDVFTLEINGGNAMVISQNEDVHDANYDHLRMQQTFAEFMTTTGPVDSSDGKQHCIYSINVYPTSELVNHHYTSAPLYYTLLVLGIFLSTILIFVVFDCLVQKRQSQVKKVALKQNAIVSSLFPKYMHSKMLEEVDPSSQLSTVGKAGIKSYLKGTTGEYDPADIVQASKPIADLFPNTTILFADIAGFTAWSSAREPSAVFRLLETLFHYFDANAKRRKVFKVEVVGDCYVAVCGMPDPRQDHAVVMAKFARECLRGMGKLTRNLEVELGPDTTELGLRIGLHSGPVVAGVLRGEKSRFQLFGDTMNTASRMESTGIPNRIQISQETAELLVAGDKGSWIVPREDEVQVKGKGKLSTFWLLQSGSGDPGRGGSEALFSSSMLSLSGRTSTSAFMGLQHDSDLADQRLAEWTVEVLASLLKEIETRRRVKRVKKDPTRVDVGAFGMKNLDFCLDELHSHHEKKSQIEVWEKKLQKKQRKKKGSTVLDEVEEIILLPEFHAENDKKEKWKDSKLELSDEVVDQLRRYVRTIASMYNRNPFHNFSHATHVTMSVMKLLSRIVAPDVDKLEQGVSRRSLHDHTYGITSDPLTRFAVVLSALIHDVDHEGVPNMQLVKENTPAAKLYKGKSVAEQNSVDVAWSLLMEPTYKQLREQIYSTEAEFKRFRQLVVNTVMATDIMDKDLKKLRNERWDRAFSTVPGGEERKNPRDVNRKATIVIEHLIQASDVAHTMQHWHIYRKWNERLFKETYKAYREGRTEKDPSIDWYKGEIGFFDFYILPLAKKLESCGVFGVSSYEYLSYAQQNRKEWEKRGQEIVAQMVASTKSQSVRDLAFTLRQEGVDLTGHKLLTNRNRTVSTTIQKVPRKPRQRSSASSSGKEKMPALEEVEKEVFSSPPFEHSTSHSGETYTTQIESSDCDLEVGMEIGG